MNGGKEGEQNWTASNEGEELEIGFDVHHHMCKGEGDDITDGMRYIFWTWTGKGRERRVGKGTTQQNSW